jgi:RNA polymerase sigma-70 factor (ECF subfamily)
MEATISLTTRPVEVSEERSPAFHEFFEATYPAVYRAVLVVTRNRQAAEDAVANAYLRALERWDAVSGQEKPIAWVIRVALNDAVSSWRRIQRLLPLAAGMSILDESRVADPDVIRAVAALPLRQRQVVALRILIGLDTRGTALSLGITEGAVTAHLHRALARLRQRLEPTPNTRNHDGR